MNEQMPLDFENPVNRKVSISRTTRQTSIDSYYALKKSGALNENQEKVLGDIAHNGPTTAGPIATRTSMPMRDVSSRCTELRDRGLLCEVGTALSPDTNRPCIQWAATDRSEPLPVKRRASVKDQLKAAQARISDLESQLEDREPGFEVTT